MDKLRQPLAQNSNKRFAGAQHPTIAPRQPSFCFDFAPTTTVMAAVAHRWRCSKQLSTDIAAAICTPAVAETPLNSGVEVIGSSSDEPAKVLAEEADRSPKSSRPSTSRPTDERAGDYMATTARKALVDDPPAPITSLFVEGVDGLGHKPAADGRDDRFLLVQAWHPPR